MKTVSLIFEKQFLHLILLGILLALLVLASRLDGFWQGEAMGLSTRMWFGIALVNTIAHQGYVWLSWRLELHLNLLSRLLGKYAFNIYALVFTLFLAMRPVLLTILAYANRDTIHIGRAFQLGAMLILTMPLIWLASSFIRYFGFSRAFGADHFEPSFRKMPLVKEGIFRVTPNAIYTFGFFLLWIVGLFFSSMTALYFALFSHLYIWVHYFCTEKPDMDRIYGKNISRTVSK
ncbi:MAG: methyltransferase [Pseudomonadota bacterium]|jgi:hypothetical protein